MQPLNLPAYDFKLRETEGKMYILDEIRKKYVTLTPEEWVRQHFIQYLVNEKQYPASLIKVEKSFKTGGMDFRADILAHNPQGIPILVVECKSFDIKITQDVFEQAARYNMKWKSPFLAVTNGLSHFCCKINHQEQSFLFVNEIPAYPDIHIYP